MRDPTRAELETARLAGEVTRRAIRRLDVFEWVIFVATLLLAILGGYGVAWLATGPHAPSFRATWAVASVLLFVVPGGVALWQVRREEEAVANRSERHPEEDDG